MPLPFSANLHSFRFTRTTHKGLPQADERDECVAVAAIDLDLDGKSVNAIDSGGTNPGEHQKFMAERTKNRNRILQIKF